MPSLVSRALKQAFNEIPMQAKTKEILVFLNIFSTTFDLFNFKIV